MYAEGDNNTKTVEIKLCKAIIKIKQKILIDFVLVPLYIILQRNTQATTKVITVGDFLQFTNKL